MKFLGLLIAFGYLLTGCATTSVNEPPVMPVSTTATPSLTPPPVEVNPTATPQNRSLFDKSPQYLCDHLGELKKMPRTTREPSGDAVYDAIIQKHYYALPCLVNKITDAQPAENPTGAPFWSGLTYRVGDTAVLMLMRFNDMYWPEGMLPRKYEDIFQTEGMFAYYFYVDEVPGARKQIQRWWKKWLKTCQPDCSEVPTLGRKRTP